MAATRTIAHIESTLIDKNGNETILFPKNTLADVRTDHTSEISAEGKVVFSGTCTTKGNIPSKVVSIEGFSLVKGAHFTVLFWETIAIGGATLSVNKFSAVPIYLKGEPLPANIILSSTKVFLEYDGMVFNIISGVNGTKVSSDNTTKFFITGVPTEVNGIPTDEFYNKSVYVDNNDTLVAPKMSAVGTLMTALDANNISQGTLAVSRLANSGATAGQYGPPTNTSVALSGAFKVPDISIDEKGRVTSIASRVISVGSNYGTCTTESSIAEKRVSCIAFNLFTGTEIIIRFNSTNTAQSPTLNVNDTGAKPIYYMGSPIPAEYLIENSTCRFRYNGSQYDMIGDMFLPITGGVISGTIHSSKTAVTYLDGNRGHAIINSSASAGSYTMLSKLNSTGGYFTEGVFQDGYLLQYTTKSFVDKDVNGVTHRVILLNEAGNTKFPGTVTASSFLGNTTSATKLQTSRTINGTSFDGSGDITTSNWGTVRNIKIGNTSKSINGSSDVVWTLGEIGASIEGHTHNYAGSSSVGGDATSALTCSGNAETATKLQTPITISLTGSMIGNINFDGSGNVTMDTEEGDISFKRQGEVPNTADWNLLTLPGCYKVQITDWGDASILHSPNEFSTGLYSFGILLVFKSAVTYEDRTVQIYLPHSTSSLVMTRMLNGSVWQSWKPIFKGIAKSDVDLGNVANERQYSKYNQQPTVAKLTTPRNINGTAFDGSVNITTENWGAQRNFKIGDTSKSVNGSVDITWTLSEIGLREMTAADVRAICTL